MAEAAFVIDETFVTQNLSHNSLGTANLHGVLAEREVLRARFHAEPANAQRKASWARLIQKIYEVDPLKCTHCGATMRIIALIGRCRRYRTHPQTPERVGPAARDPLARHSSSAISCDTRIQRSFFVLRGSTTR